MSSDINYLNDFVYPVPICQPGADLGSILSIFQHLNCKFLAIPQETPHWGIVYSEDLLGFMAAAWKGSTTAVVSHLRHIAPQQAMTTSSTLDLQSIIKPAQVYGAEMELEEFLNQINHDPISSDRGECLVVNAAGELKGSLDREKIIQFLAQKSPSPPSKQPQLGTSLSYLSKLTEGIALPLKIETAAGQELYRNQLWQQQISDDRCITPACQTIPQQLAGDKLQYQFVADFPQSALQSFSTANLHAPEFNSGDRVSSGYSLRADKQNQGSLRDTASNASNPEAHNHLNHQQPLNLVNSSWSLSAIESSSYWNYLKIPLTTDSLLWRQTEQDPYYLVIATPAVAIKSPPSTEPCCLNGTHEVTNNLLASISHELKSPLTGIVGLSNLLQEQKLGQLNQRQARYVQLIHRSGQTMMGIIDDLLQLTHLTIEDREPELVNLKLLCHQIYQEAIAKVHGTGSPDFDAIANVVDLQLDIKLDSELILTNRQLLSCILSHLILSAIQVADSQPTIAINISNSSGLIAFTINYHLFDLVDGNASQRLVGSHTGKPFVDKLVPKEDAMSVFKDTATHMTDALSNGAGSQGQNWILDLIIAEYLATVLDGSISQSVAQDRGQFTLVIPENQHQQSQLINNLHPTPVAEQQTENHNLTILCLYPELEAINPATSDSNSSNFNLKSWIDNHEQQSNYQHRIIEADSLEQAHTLARIWRFDVIILDSYQLIQPGNYLRSLLESEYLAALPLITLDTITTEAANQIEGLNVYPCLLPAQDCSVQDLIQVIEIATGI